MVTTHFESFQGSTDDVREMVRARLRELSGCYPGQEIRIAQMTAHIDPVGLGHAGSTLYLVIEVGSPERACVNSRLAAEYAR